MEPTADEEERGNESSASAPTSSKDKEEEVPTAESREATEGGATTSPHGEEADSDADLFEDCSDLPLAPNKEATAERSDNEAENANAMELECASTDMRSIDKNDDNERVLLEQLRAVKEEGDEGILKLLRQYKALHEYVGRVRPQLSPEVSLEMNKNLEGYLNEEGNIIPLKRMKLGKSSRKMKSKTGKAGMRPDTALLGGRIIVPRVNTAKVGRTDRNDRWPYGKKAVQIWVNEMDEPIPNFKPLRINLFTYDLYTMQFIQGKDDLYNEDSGEFVNPWAGNDFWRFDNTRIKRNLYILREGSIIKEGSMTINYQNKSYIDINSDGKLIVRRSPKENKEERDRCQKFVSEHLNKDGDIPFIIHDAIVDERRKKNDPKTTRPLSVKIWFFSNLRNVPAEYREKFANTIAIFPSDNPLGKVKQQRVEEERMKVISAIVAETKKKKKNRRKKTKKTKEEVEEDEEEEEGIEVEEGE